MMGDGSGSVDGGDLLAAGAGNGIDQVIALVVDTQGGFVDLDGDVLPGVARCR
jgi:hypothetical protein